MWRAHLLQTMTGRVGAELNIAADGSWSIPLNGIEEFQVTVAKRQVAAVDRRWWSPFQGGIVMSWERPDGGLVPWVAGPIVEPPSETRGVDGTVTFSCRGIGAILEKRVVLDRDHTDMQALARSRVMPRGLSLGTIMQEVVRKAVEPKLGGRIPVVFRSPRETGARLNDRTYEGWNLSNNGAWKRLGELSNVRGGPDFQLRPEMTAEGLVWALYHGTAVQPGIAQDWTMDLDSTSERSPVASVEPTADASNLVSRVYWTGAGEGAGVLIRMVQDESRLANHMPLLERVGSTSDSENPELLTAHARAALDAGRGPLRQLSMVIDGSDPRCEIGRWRVGDLARVTTGEEWLTVPAGTRDERIIAAKGTWSSSMVTLEFQGDEAFEPEQEVME